MDLLFERFLSEERGEWPDIDLDLPSGDQRERAIQYVYERYGQLGAAMTANVITYKGRSAVRDVGKVLGLEESELKKLADLMPQFEWKDPDDTMRRRFQEAGLSPGHPRIAKFFSLTEEVLRLPRHLGQHSGGLVVCQGQLDSVVPHRDSSGDHPAGTHTRRHAASVSAPPSGTRSASLVTSLFKPGVGTNAGSFAVSGTVVKNGDDRGQL
jgi:error-prone DNA polymerase